MVVSSNLKVPRRNYHGFVGGKGCLRSLWSSHVKHLRMWLLSSMIDSTSNFAFNPILRVLRNSQKGGDNILDGPTTKCSSLLGGVPCTEVDTCSFRWSMSFSNSFQTWRSLTIAVCIRTWCCKHVTAHIQHIQQWCQSKWSKLSTLSRSTLLFFHPLAWQRCARIRQILEWWQRTDMAGNNLWSIPQMLDILARHQRRFTEQRTKNWAQMFECPNSSLAFSPVNGPLEKATQVPWRDWHNEAITRFTQNIP